MNDYIFFDEGLRDRFLAFVAEHGLEARTEADRIDGHLVIVPDQLTDDLQDTLDDEYDRLMDEQQEIVEAEDEQDHTLMGVDITLPDGTPCTVRLPPELGRRLCENFSGEEIRALATAIAADAVNPASGPICCERD
ncbi:MAG: hypothetical protein KJ634_03380 [Gammaproteobacteria bacterium]|nr:hypothetical protein [Gammaproteobacteria bacterium]MBU1414645.1 hypothetical protein [Gammaproteobacteria bacterium]